MRRVWLALPTNRACAGAIAAVGEEAAYGARRFGIEVHLLVLDRAPASAHAEHRKAVAALPPSRVSYGACANRAFLIAQALGCTSVHRRDSDSRYQRLDQDTYRELVGLSTPEDYPEIWRGHLIDASFRGAGDTAFGGDRITLTTISPMHAGMCDIGLGHEVYGKVPLPPTTNTIGSECFLTHLVHDARLPGVQHNRHIANFHTEERRTDSGFLAYQLRFAKFLLSMTYLNAVYARTAAAGDAPLDAERRIRARVVAGFVRDSIGLDRGGRYATVTDTLADRRSRLLDEARDGMADFALLMDHWEALTRASAAAGRGDVSPVTAGHPPAVTR
ncbi:DUF6271 family protein [Streptomyces sp. C11-1]|uniref:DUF6271 family protein n=1 Tax=Streptomyces durocortorensis TaxID=2811104 RepID=A0ABY9VS89_9ACTN|nr:DUF6271 family protein [Streptomyces durocortorensis]WNF26786.1 DUF6271 family protein [Streptomyces durocortorensis]